MKKLTSCFTLAEVLITIGIIGIVAAMTLPSLITNYQKKQTVTQLKKVYSIMSQALQRAELDYGNFEHWNFFQSGAELNNKYIKPYYTILTDYDKTDFPNDYSITCNNGGNCIGYGGFRTASKMIIVDGTMLAINPAYSLGTPFMTIMVDLNGLKKPNKYGRDIFLFTVQPENGLLPYGVGKLAGDIENESYDRNYLLNGEYRSCQRDGIFCAALIMSDNWEIRNDYPW